MTPVRSGRPRFPTWFRRSSRFVAANQISDSVSICRCEWIRDETTGEESYDFIDAVGDGPLGREAKTLGEFLEAHAVVPWIFVSMHELDVPAWKALAENVDDVEFAVVLVRVTNIEHLAGDRGRRRLENVGDRASRVTDVHVWPPELLTEDHQLVAHREVTREFVHRQVEPHPWRRPEDGCEPKTRGSELTFRRQHLLLGRDLRFGIERNGSEL